MNNWLTEVIAQEERYEAGYEAGKQAALLEIQSELHEIALKSSTNNNETRYENLVVMLSDVDKVINKKLEEI